MNAPGIMISFRHLPEAQEFVRLVTAEAKLRGASLTAKAIKVYDFRGPGVPVREDGKDAVALEQRRTSYVIRHGQIDKFFPRDPVQSPPP